MLLKYIYLVLMIVSFSLSTESYLPKRRIIAEWDEWHNWEEIKSRSDSSFTMAANETWKMKENKGCLRGWTWTRWTWSDILITNASPLDFTLKHEDCTQSSWTSGMEPEFKLPSKKSIIIGAEGTEFMRGLHCQAVYGTKDHGGPFSWFDIESSNPFVGGNSAIVRLSENLNAELYLTSGKGNQVRLILNCSRKDCLI